MARSSKDFFLAGALALVLSFVLFGNGISGDFVFDDTIVIVGNPFIDGQLENFWEIFTTPYFAYQPRPGLYRPLTIASYAINVFVFGFSPASFHVTNILLHALASYLIFVLFYKLSEKTVLIGEIDRGFSIRVWRVGAYAGFLFFMFLPIHVEAVTSIIGRAEILSLLFVVGALLFLLKQKYILASGAFFLGLLSKETAIAFLPIFLFLEYYALINPPYGGFISNSEVSGVSVSKLTSRLRQVLVRLLYFIPALAIYAIFRYVALGGYFLKNDATSVYNPIKFASFLTGLWTSFKVFYLYLGKTFFPVSLSTDYSFNQISLVEDPFSSTQAILGIVILAVLIFIFFKTRNIFAKFGIFIFLSSYFVISNWVFKTGTIMAERLMYMPSLGLVILASVWINDYLLSGSRFYVLSFKRKEPKLIAYSLLLIATLSWYSYVIIDRNRDWLNEKNLFESAYAVAPNSVVNKTNKAYLDFTAGNYTEAESRLNEVLAIAPEHVPTLNLAGQNYKKLGQYQKAEELWKKALELRNDYLRVYLSLGILYYENGYFKSAEKVLTDAINIYPRWSEVLFLSLTKVSLGEPEEAINIIEKHFGDNPAEKKLKFALGWAYFDKGEKNKAYGYFVEVKDPKMSMEEFVKTFEGSRVILLGDF